MTNLLKDILREPAELSGILAYTAGPGRAALEAAARIAEAAPHLFVTGIGSSWHAAMAVSSLFDAGGRACQAIDASELLSLRSLPPDSAIIVLSRSGRSFEVVGVLDKSRKAGTKVIGVTNSPDSPLAEAANVVLALNAGFDHLVSVTMYSGLVLAGGLLAAASTGSFGEELCRQLCATLTAAARDLENWRALIESSDWPAPGAPTYFLGRGASVATCHEARLLWEEAAKTPATATTTGGFRHGPQEIIRDGVRVGLWIDPAQMRGPDLALAEDLRVSGAKVLVVGQDLSPGCGDLVISLPAAPDSWQPLIDVIPSQIAAENLSRLNGEDCDSFRFCPYIIETAGGLGGR